MWRYDGEQLEINQLQNGRYVISSTSGHFPQFPLVTAIPQYVKQSQIMGRNATMKVFRVWVKSYLSQYD